MKKTITLIACMVYTIAGYSQTFTQLSTDIQGDDHSGFGMDAKSIGYLIDFSQDSIWFQIESWDNRHADWGYVVAVDTDMVALNGKAINQHNIASGTPNNDMTFDILIYVYENSFFPGINYEVHDTAGYLPITGSYKVMSPTIAIIGMRLSDIDADGDMNIIGGVGSFDISATGPSDVIPNTGFGTTSSTISIEENLALEFNMYPNPAKDHLFIKMDNSSVNDQVKIISVLGSEVYSGSLETKINTSNLENGLYMVLIERDGKTIAAKKLAVRH